MLLSLTPLARAATLDVDGLAVVQERNDVQIPNSAAGTRFSLVDTIGDDPAPGIRLTLVTQGFAEKQQWRFIVAPFSIQEDGMLNSSVDFNGVRFDIGPVRTKYVFNSYRATYRWSFASTAHWQWFGGVTVKIRDAEIALSQDGVSSSKTNTGVVPLLHIAGEARYGAWRISFDGDGLASSQGRAIDIGGRIGYALSPMWEAFAGLRAIEGGADNDEVYNFAWLNQLSLGVRAHF